MAEIERQVIQAVETIVSNILQKNPQAHDSNFLAKVLSVNPLIVLYNEQEMGVRYCRSTLSVAEGDVVLVSTVGGTDSFLFIDDKIA